MSDRVDSSDAYLAPWEKTFDQILTPFEEFIHQETAGSVVLIACTVVALILANSPLAEPYAHILHTHLTLRIGTWEIDHTLHHWINDGLMALFFFVVGLEIKREVLVGDLSNVRAAIVPILAAAGGMIFPAVVYALFNFGGEGARGWGVPMATDIAFAVGVMALLGDRIPKTLLSFLVALAIVDDLGAVAVIALFYTEQINTGPLLLAGGLIGILIVFNLTGIRKPLPYFLVGLLLWVAMLESGVHATIAGILAAWTIPARPKYDPGRFSKRVHELIKRFDRYSTGTSTLIDNENQRAVVRTLEKGVRNVESPLQRLEHAMHTPVSFFIVPVFALTNAGVPIDLASLGTVLTQPVSLGIIFGLFIGKLVGIATVSIAAVRLGLGQLPQGCRAVHMVGVGLLAGIGFTMSVFIAELAFKDQSALLNNAKTGILFASLIAGVGGYLWLRVLGKERVA